MVIINIYRVMTRRDIFTLDLSRFEEPENPASRKALHFISYVLKYILLYPLISFAWFGILFIIVSIIATDREAKDLLLSAMLALALVRIMSYYSTTFARHFARFLPLTVVSILILDLRHIHIDLGLLARGVVDEGETFFYYWIFIVLLELTLRAAEPIWRFLRLRERFEVIDD